MCIAALKRKGKGSDVEEADMEAVVHAHNSEHQKSWRPCLLTAYGIDLCHSNAMSGTCTSVTVWDHGCFRYTGIACVVFTC